MNPFLHVTFNQAVDALNDLLDYESLYIYTRIKRCLNYVNAVVMVYKLSAAFCC